MKLNYRKIPATPGVYLMRDGEGRILYIGKAGNLRRRVSSYFTRPHDRRLENLVSQVRKIDYRKTDTVIEALMLESKLIKKFSPRFNIRGKDDKSFLYVEVTDEKFPRVLLVRGKTKPEGQRFGPFTSASSTREALKIIRRIFPFSLHPPGRKSEARPCLDYEMGLCPGVCVGRVKRSEYLQDIGNLKLFFEGKKKKILTLLERGMRLASRGLEYEKAAKISRQIFALRHIQDVALLRDPGDALEAPNFRIEGYDISNISGNSAAGSMVVFFGREPVKDEYRLFRIKTVTGQNDTGMLKEILGRRFKNDWRLPDLILIDGGLGQVNAAKMVLNGLGLKIPVIGIAKGPRRKKNEIIGNLLRGVDEKTLIKVRDEAHRFALSYHRKLRGNVMNIHL